MKNVYWIARLELAAMFCSPIAWLLLIIFAVQCALTFIGLLDVMEAGQQVGQNTVGITHALLAARSGLYTSVLRNLYLYIPLLTMGLISRETHSGSIKLLLSSPVSTREIVFGKYLAMLIYGALMLAVLLALVLTGTLTVENFDTPFALSGLAGIYLLIGVYAAIGLFMSSLTNYQVVAAISTLAVLAALNAVGEVWQDVAFVRDVTYFLSIAGRVEKLVAGLLSSRDILYFLIVIALFLGFSILKLRSGRHSDGLLRQAIGYAALSLVLLAVGYAGSRPSLVAYFDTTAGKRQTLTPASQQVIAQIGASPITLTSYVNLLDVQHSFEAMPARQNADAERFEMYTRFAPQLQMKYVYYYDEAVGYPGYQPMAPQVIRQKAAEMAAARRLDLDMFLPPERIRQVIDLRAEHNLLVRKFELDGRRSFLRHFQFMPRDPTEREITAALKSLVAKPVKVAVVTGHGERSISGFHESDYSSGLAGRFFAQSLINLGFDPTAVSLREDLPDDVDIVVLADPKSPLAEDELARLHAYLRSGGDLLVAAEPGNAAVLQPVLAPLGVSVLPGMLVQSSQTHAPEKVIASVDSQVLQADDVLARWMSRAPQLLMEGAAALAYDNTGSFRALSLITTWPDTWIRARPLPSGAVDVSFSEELGDQRGSVPAVLALHRELEGGEQKIVVLGDADAFSNRHTFNNGTPSGNQAFMTALFAWLCDGRFPVDVARPPHADRKITASATAIAALRIAYVWVVPCLLFACGALVLIRRNRR